MIRRVSSNKICTVFQKKFQIDSYEHIINKITIAKYLSKVNNKRLVYKNIYL